MQLQSMIEEFWFLCYSPAKYLRALIPNCNLPSSVEKGKKKSFHLQFLWDRMKGAGTLTLKILGLLSQESQNCDVTCDMDIDK